MFKGKAKFRPGERYAYSNGGYVFLGMLIEKLTGILYRDFIREHVLQAANMHKSGFYAFNDLPENTANGYLEDQRTTLNTHCTFNDTDGYGCGLYKRLDDSTFWIEGGDAGVGFDSSHLPQDKLTINILSNITNGEEAIRDVVLGFL